MPRGFLMVACLCRVYPFAIYRLVGTLFLWSRQRRTAQFDGPATALRFEALYLAVVHGTAYPACSQVEVYIGPHRPDVLSGAKPATDGPGVEAFKPVAGRRVE